MTRSSSRRRLHHIGAVATRQGLGYLVGPTGAGRLVPFERGWLGHDRRDNPYTRPEHLRLALEELGTTFVKLGQIVSTRGDLLPSDYQTELSRLQDSVAPVPAADILSIISTEFGCRIESVFATFDLKPLASASIGQVHAATLIDGSEVVVKVRRPGVVAQIDEDLELLTRLAMRAAQRSKKAMHYDILGLAAEFGRTLCQELDYLREGHNAERFASNFAGDVSIHIPRVYWEATTSQVLTLERLRGVKVSELAELDAAGLDRPALARAAALITLRMVFEHGLFHADPHPGNFFVEPDGTIGLIDFGMVGSVDTAARGRLAALLGGFASRNGDVLLDNVLTVSVATADVDRQGLRNDLLALAAEQLDRPLADVSFGTLLGGMLGVARRHRLVLLSDLALVVPTTVPIALKTPTAANVKRTGPSTIQHAPAPKALPVGCRDENRVRCRVGRRWRVEEDAPFHPRLSRSSQRGQCGAPRLANAVVPVLARPASPRHQSQPRTSNRSPRP